jgi:hypothetical protein
LVNDFFADVEHGHGDGGLHQSKRGVQQRHAWRHRPNHSEKWRDVAQSAELFEKIGYALAERGHVEGL